jgi:hypothetical protein
MTIKNWATQFFIPTDKSALRLKRRSPNSVTSDKVASAQDADDCSVFLQRRDEKSTLFGMFVQRLKKYGQIWFSPQLF